MFDMPAHVQEFLQEQERKAADERKEREQKEIAEARERRQAREETQATERETPIDWGSLSEKEYREELQRRGIPFTY